MRYTVVPPPIRGRHWEHHRHERSSHRRAGALAVRLPPAAAAPEGVAGPGLCDVTAWDDATAGAPLRRRLHAEHPDLTAAIVVVSDPQLAKQVFTTSPDELGNIQPNLSRLFGSGSVFALDGDDHRRRRRLLAPPFHGKSIKNYETIIEEETLRETADWPEGRAVRNAAVDDAHHAQRHPARGVRGRRRRTRRAAPAHPAVGHAGLATGGAAETQTQLWSFQPVGPAGRVAAPVRRRHRQADRRRAGRPELRRSDRCARADAAQHLRRRFGHVAQGHRRRTAHAAGRRSRNDGVHAGLGVRAVDAGTRTCWRPWSRRPTVGRMAARAAPGDDPGGPAGQDGHRLRRPPRLSAGLPTRRVGHSRAGIRSS